MSPRVLVLVAVITAFAPLSMDLYLPGLPELRHDLGATDQQAALTVTGCILGLALGQFLVSLVPERYGRRPPLLLGMSLWIVATVLCALAPSIWALVGLRLVQGVGAGAAIALARAVVADLDPAHLSTHLSRMMLVLSVVPILAPAVGGLTLSVVDWRGLFLGLAATGAVLLVVVSTSLAESRPPTPPTSSAVGPVDRSTPRPMAALVRSPAFLLPALISGAGFGVMFSYIGESPFVFQEDFGLGPTAYGVVFGVNAAALILGFQVGPVVERRLGTRGALRLAGLVGSTGAAGMLVASAGLTDPVVPTMASLMLVLCGGGMIVPVATAAAIDSHPDLVGATSGLAGALQFLVGGLIGTLPPILPAVLPIAAGAPSLALVCLGCLLLGLLGARRLPAPADAPPLQDEGVLETVTPRCTP